MANLRTQPAPKFSYGNIVNATDNFGKVHHNARVLRCLGMKEYAACPEPEHYYEIASGTTVGIFVRESQMNFVDNEINTTRLPNELSGKASLAETRPSREEWDKAMRKLKNCGVSDSELRKMQPVGTLVTQYFPDALLAVSAVAWVGNEKHNPGQHLHWARGKSDDHLDCDVRHLIDSERGNDEELRIRASRQAKLPPEWDVTKLPDGREYAVLHAAQHAWRALALLQLEVEKHGGEVIKVLKLASEGTNAQEPAGEATDSFQHQRS